MFPSQPFKEKNTQAKSSLLPGDGAVCYREPGDGSQGPLFLFSGKQGCPPHKGVSSSYCLNVPGLSSWELTQKQKGGTFEKRKGLEPGLLFPCPPPCPWRRDGNSLSGWRVLYRWPQHVHMGSDWKKRCVCYRFGSLYLRGNNTSMEGVTGAGADWEP